MDGRIQTHGNTCFVERAGIRLRGGEPDPAAPAPRKKPEKVNLKFGKIRIQVTHARRVRVSQDGGAMVITLDE